MTKQALESIYANFKANGFDTIGEGTDLFDEVIAYGTDIIKDMGYTVADHGLIHSQQLRMKRFIYGFIGKKSDHRYEESTLWIIKARKPDMLIYVKSWYVRKHNY